VLVNTVLLASIDLPPPLAEAVAPAILFFGSGWNSGLTGTTLTIDPTDVAQGTPISPAGDDSAGMEVAL
jgi:hypothetical protein